MQIKRWESPRREGRNDKGRKSSARQRQIKKATQMLRRKLKGNEGKDQGLSFFCVNSALKKEAKCLPPIVL